LAGVDTIEHGEDLDEEAARIMAKKGVILVPTLQLIVNWYKDFIPLDGNDGERLERARPDAFLYRDMLSPPDAAFGVQYAKQATESFSLAKELGVKIALGSDTVYEPLTKYGEYSALEFKALVEYGMTVSEAVTAATKTAAEALGLAAQIGTVDCGEVADLLVVRKDPTASEDVLYDPANIHMVFCDGILTVEDGRFAY
jgi:imidazolonepropionase-like amidohydrolase